MGTGLAAAALRIAWVTCLGATGSRLAYGVLAWLLQAPCLPEGYWPGCYRPQVGLGVLAWLLFPIGGTGLAATALRIAFWYWPGCYKLQVGLRVTGLAATGPRLA